MNKESRVKSNFLEETSIGVEQLLRDYSIEYISSDLAQVNIGSNSFFTQIEPLTDFQVLHRREILDQEYQDFLEKTQRQSGVNELTGLRSERLNSGDISTNALTNSVFSNQALNEIQPRPERDNVPLQQPLVDPYIRHLLSKNSIQLVEDVSKLNQDFREQGFTVLELASSRNFVNTPWFSRFDRNPAQAFSGFRAARPERNAQENSGDVEFASSKSSEQEIVDRIKNVSQVVREVSQNRSDRLKIASEQKAQSTSASSLAQDMSQTTESFFDGTEYTVKQGEKVISCPAFSGSPGFKPLPEGNYCVREQGVGFGNGGWSGRIAKITEGNLNLLQNSLRSKWFMVEPQFSMLEPRTKLATHAGSISEGCATITDSDCFARVADIYNSSEPFIGFGYDGYPPGSVDKNGLPINKPLKEVTCVATLTVDYSGQQGVVQRSGKRSNTDLDAQRHQSRQGSYTGSRLGELREYENQQERQRSQHERQHERQQSQQRQYERQEREEQREKRQEQYDRNRKDREERQQKHQERRDREQREKERQQRENSRERMSGPGGDTPGRTPDLA